jgi:hypothetical protein
VLKHARPKDLSQQSYYELIYLILSGRHLYSSLTSLFYVPLLMESLEGGWQFVELQDEPSGWILCTGD